MFGIDESSGTAGGLGCSDSVQGQSRLARAFWAVDFNDATLRQAADAESDVETQGTGRDSCDAALFAVAAAHGYALAERAIELGKGGYGRLGPDEVVVGYGFEVARHFELRGRGITTC